VARHFVNVIIRPRVRDRVRVRIRVRVPQGRITAPDFVTYPSSGTNNTPTPGNFKDIVVAVLAGI